MKKEVTGDRWRKRKEEQPQDAPREAGFGPIESIQV
jgi:hypothetical protein